MSDKKPAVTRVNKLLKLLGRPERLVRGRGYYYVTGVSVSSSLYVYQLEPTDADYRMAAEHVEQVLAAEDASRARCAELPAYPAFKLTKKV